MKTGVAAARLSIPATAMRENFIVEIFPRNNLIVRSESLER